MGYALIPEYDKESLDRYINLQEGEIVIGSDPNIDVVVDNNQVSRNHALLRIIGTDDPEITIRDLDSTNGTFINGFVITGTEHSKPNHIPLRSGDVITLAKTAGVQFTLRDSYSTMTPRHLEIELNPINDELSCQGQIVRHKNNMTETNVRFLRTLFDHKGQLVTYVQLRQSVMANHHIGAPQGDPYQWCQNRVRELRKALPERYVGFLICNEPNRGYRLRLPDVPI